MIITYTFTKFGTFRLSSAGSTLCSRFESFFDLRKLVRLSRTVCIIIFEEEEEEGCMLHTEITRDGYRGEIDFQVLFKFFEHINHFN